MPCGLFPQADKSGARPLRAVGACAISRRPPITSTGQAARGQVGGETRAAKRRQTAEVSGRSTAGCRQVTAVPVSGLIGIRQTYLLVAGRACPARERRPSITQSPMVVAFVSLTGRQMTEIDQIQYGRLLASFDHLTAQLRTTSQKLETLELRLEEVEGRFRFGKGALAGLLFAAGAIGIGLKEVITGLFGR